VAAPGAGVYFPGPTDWGRIAAEPGVGGRLRPLALRREGQLPACILQQRTQRCGHPTSWLIGSLRACVMHVFVTLSTPALHRLCPWPAPL